MTSRTALLAVVGCLLLAGCGGVIGDSPRDTPSTSDEYPGALAVDAPTISPGETGTLTIEMRNASTLRVETIRSDAVRIDYRKASHSPRPDTTWTTYSPSWSWSWNGTNVTTTLPVVATENATRGRYNVTINAGVDGGGRNHTAVVTVE